MSDLMLLRECIGWAELCINENTGNGKTTFRGKFQEANSINKNKRMYPFEVLSGNVDRLDESIKLRSLYGELDHPQDSIIHLKESSHLITKLWWEDNTLMGEGEVLPTPAGKVLKAIMDAGGRIGISSRGVGNGQVNNEGVLVIGESYKLITFDAVADPSTFAAFQQRIAKDKTENYKIPAKNETQSINTFNSDVFVSFIEQLLQKKTGELKEEIAKKEGHN